MNYGLYISASGAASSIYRMDVAANNLANINTVGFKPDRAAAVQRDAARIEDNVRLPSNAMLERLGAGVRMFPTRVTFEQGPLQATTNDLDLAIQGRGFFVVRDETDTSGDRIRLTRDGRFTRDAGGRLVTAGDGRPVLDVSNRPIMLPPGPVQIGGDGVITCAGEEIARLQLVDVPDASRLIKIGHGFFQIPSDALSSRQPGTGLIRQGHLEGAAVDPILAMLAVTTARDEAERNMGMIQHHDRLMDRAVNVLGRVT